MTQEDKDLLLVDLCARLPYGVKCYVPVENCTMELTGKRLNYFCFHKDVWGIDYSHEFEIVIDPLNDAHNGYVVKPYLRPMSSMTEEEKHELYSSCGIISLDFERRTTDMVAIFNSAKVVDYFNAHHFDYRGLIPKGLAIEAPEGMYN